MSDNINGKVIVITGASSGLGLAAARLLGFQGARLSWVHGASADCSNWPRN
jgi:NAD(P)-dependent dehydrogenase (short-subunit alcohol dehydrogenase family)